MIRNTSRGKGYKNDAVPVVDRSEYQVGPSVGVLDKIVTILRAFPAGNAALSPQEIAARTGLSLPTVYRLLQTLDEHNLVEREGARYRLGLALQHLGMRVADGVEMRHQAMPHLEWLNNKMGENPELHTRREETRVPIELVRSSHNLRPFVEIGESLPLHLGAAGKGLLAWLPENEGERLAAASAARFGSGTLSAENTSTFDADTLHAQLLWGANRGMGRQRRGEKPRRCGGCRAGLRCARWRDLRAAGERAVGETPGEAGMGACLARRRGGVPDIGRPWNHGRNATNLGGEGIGV